ncbi:hypothetical protein FUAX_18550 [Fulvitalea axinellae]|uniref:FAS1 domain-containing protein n=1 Tax=Fulvitalea axinellae TaxID=1182444 RepID=A0AAU9CN15_9BACT|nr:hypothetical protein FUAX_18550 [Fulvitalea axinellae]
MRNFFRIILISAWVPLFFSCDEKDDHFLDPGSGLVQNVSVGKYLSENSEYAYFSKLLESSGYMDSVSGTRPVTVFLPPEGALESLNIPQDSLEKLVTYHIGNTLLYDYHFDKKEDSGEYLRRFIKTLYAKKNVWADKDGTDITLDLEMHIQGDPVICTNGLVYKLDKALLPKKNIFEGLQGLPDSYMAFNNFVLKDSLLFDKVNSPVLGVDEFGDNVYDSLFILDYVYLQRYGRIDNEDHDFTSLLMSDKALENTIGQMVKRYYGSEENLPDYFEDEEFIETLRERVLASTILREKVTDLQVGDTVRTTSVGKIIITPEWLSHQPKRFSNGYLYEISEVQMLMGEAMGRRNPFDASESEFLKYDFDREDIELDVAVKGGEVAMTFVAEAPFWVEYTLEKVMAGEHKLYIEGLRSGTTEAKVILDGKVLDNAYRPSGEWKRDLYRDLYFPEFGDKVIRFEVNVANKDGEYKLALNEFVFYPVYE